MNNLFNDVDAYLITSPYNLRYFTNFTGGEGFALLTKEQNYLLVDSRYTGAALSEVKNTTVIEYHGKTLYSEILRLYSNHNAKNSGFEDKNITYSQYQILSEKLSDISFVPKSEELNSCRMIKTEEELSFLRHAEDIGVMAFKHILPYIKENVSENDIATEIDHFMRKQGATASSFETIVVSGVKSSMPHGRPDDKKFEIGDFITMDFGCIYNGYCSDMTRTVVLGKASEEQKKIYEIVKEAQQVGLNSIKAGIFSKDADKAARDVIEVAGYGQYFGHSLGHGVGLEIHELPNLSPLSDVVLEENMIVTCEPGIYIPNLYGVRIEDMVCVKKNGAENMTNLSKELIVLE